MFNDWSFKKLYEAAGRLRSDPAMKGNVKGLVEDLTQEQKARYHRLVLDPPSWRRPQPEDAAKEMDLTILYRYGYDYASRHVHLMANDGQEDFYNITGVEPRPEFAKSAATVVLSNSVLIASMILQEALNGSTLLWQAIVFDAIDGVRKFLLSASPEDHLAVAKVGIMFKEHMSLAQPREPSSAS